MRAPNFSQNTKDTLAARAALICNNPSCSCLTIGPSDGNGQLSLKIGEAAHILAARVGEARYDKNMTDSDRADIKNEYSGKRPFLSSHRSPNSKGGEAMRTAVSTQRMAQPFKMVIWGLLIVTLMTPLTGCESGGDDDGPIITAAEYNEVQSGMTYDQVRAIIGDDPTDVQDSTLYPNIAYVWDNPDGSYGIFGFSHATGGMVAKTQHGLL